MSENEKKNSDDKIAKRIAKAVPKRTGKFFVWLGAILLLLGFIIQIAVWAGVAWLNSEGGQNWTKAQLDTALKESGYTIGFDRFHYSPLTNITIGNFTVSDKEGELVTGERLRLHLDILPLAAKNLRVSLDMESLEIARLPAKAEDIKEDIEDDTKDPNAALMQPFEVPDIYFSTISVSSIEIRSLKFAEGVAGPIRELAPELKGHIDLESHSILSSVSLFLGQPDEASKLAYLPEKISLSTLLDTKNPSLVIEKIAVQSNAYSVHGRGDVDLGKDGKTKIEINAASEDVSLLSPDLNGKFEARAKIEGPQSALSLGLDAMLDLAQIRERGLSPINLNLTLDNLMGVPNGNTKIESNYQNVPIAIKSDFRFEDAILTLNNLSANAPELNIGGQLKLNTQTTLADGRISADIKSFAPYKELLQTDIAGRAKADIELAARDGKQFTSIKTTLSNLAYEAITLEALSLAAQIPDALNPWPSSANLSVKQLRSGETLLTKLNADVSRKNPNLYGLTASAEGFALQKFTLNASSDLKGIETSAPSAENIKATVTTGGGTANLTGRADQKAVKLNLTAKEFPLTAIPAELPANLAVLTMNVDANLFGNLENPEASAAIDLSPIRTGEDLPEVKISIDGAYKNSKTSVNLLGEGEGIKTLTAALNIPLKLSLYPYALDLSDKTPLNGSFKGDLQVDSLAEILLPTSQSLQGLVKTTGKIGGTVFNPDLAAQFTMDNARFEEKTSGFKLSNMNARANFEQNVFTLESLTANDNEAGTLEGRGRYSLGTNADADFTITAKSLHLFKSQMVDGKINADLAMNGAGKKYNLSGTIRPEYIDINIPERFGTSIPQVNTVEKSSLEDTDDDSPITIALDILFDAPQRLFVRGWGLDSEFGGSLDIKGTAAEPTVEGTMKSKRGTFKEFGKKFELARANLRFSGTMPPSPYLDILAETQAEDIKAQINLTGSVLKPGIKMSSVPALPEDEVLAKILFGKDITDISAYQAYQLTQTLRRFSGQGGGAGFDPLGTALGVTGLDDLNVELDDEGGATVGAGKYLTDKVYLEVESGSTENSGAARIEIEVTPSISVESEIGQDAQGGAGVFWKHDY